MRALRKPFMAAAIAAAAFGIVQAAPADDQAPREYVVVYEQGMSDADARAAVADAGGEIIDENSAVGVATVRSAAADFKERAAGEGALVGAADNRPIGRAGPKQLTPPGTAARDWKRPPREPQAEPFAAAQWDMAMIGADTRGSYRTQQGDRDVLVGIIDTGVDASHPDIAPNFDNSLSRNFTVDMPDVDGPCEEESDQSCEDPPTEDPFGHGTHVAGTVGAPLNGVGIGGVAPGTRLVNLRAAQDSGYFFLKGTVDALTYAGDNGIDVVNMSFFVDPWLYNCPSNPKDTPEQSAEQRTIIAGIQAALRYAHERGVTLVASAGNQDDDLGDPEPESGSPNHPGSGEPIEDRDADNSCLTLPTEGDNVLAVTALGPSKRKSYYSNYGISEADLSAPGGDTNDTPPPSPGNQVLSAYPNDLAKAALAAGANPANYPTDGQGNYWRYLQGTSMASPHAAGVAALVVAEHGKRDRRHDGLTLDPGTVEKVMRRQATDTPCPEPRRFVYPPPRNTDQYTAVCEGSRDRNGFYGDGIVNAAAVGEKNRR
jgi:subtilisin family serine protease